MFNNFFGNIKCEFCKEGTITYNPQLTFEAYTSVDSFTLNNIDKVKDGIIGQYLVFKCGNCDSIMRYTYKEVERLVRKDISEKAIYTLARGELLDPSVWSPKDKVLKYCGKCPGFDGSGSCLLKIYNKCKLKRLPNEL